MTQEKIKILTKFKNGEILSESEIETLFAENSDITDTTSPRKMDLRWRYICDCSEILGFGWFIVLEKNLTRTNELRKLGKEAILAVIAAGICSGGFDIINGMVFVNEAFSYCLIAYDVKFFDRNKLIAAGGDLYRLGCDSSSTIADVEKILDA